MAFPYARRPEEDAATVFRVGAQVRVPAAKDRMIMVLSAVSSKAGGTPGTWGD
jgi:hypothetical protein